MNLIPVKPLVKGPNAAATDEALLRLAFNNSAQANIISIVSTGKIVITNAAACKLLGYSKKELLTKSRRNIFDIKEAGFKKMLEQRTTEGNSVAIVTVLKKSGKAISCEIMSTVFTDDEGIERSTTSITDISKKVLAQKVIDKEKEKVVADNIILAKAVQKTIDINKDKIVADNIVVANSIVAGDIAMALERSNAGIAENKKWITHIAKASYDVMWDWDLVTGLVYIGESIKELFGYKLKNNSIRFSDLEKYFIPEKNKPVKEIFKKILASTSRSWSESYKIRRKDGSVASVNSRAAIIRDINGKALRLIGATQDVSKLQELENKVEQQSIIKKDNDDIFYLAAKLSYDGIWDWNILTNEFFLGEGFKDLFGYAFINDHKEAFNWADFLHPGDKEAVEKSIEEVLASSATRWELAYRFVRANGSVANVFGRATIIRDTEGKACRMIGVIHDLSRQKELEDKLEKEIAGTSKLRLEYNESFRLMFNSSSDILYDIDLITDDIVLSDGYEKEFGHPITPFMKSSVVWGSHLHPEDKERVLEDYHRMLASKETSWKCSYRFLKADGSVANILSSRIILRNSDGIPYRMIGSMQDISKQTVLEEKLAHEIKLKEKQIADAMQDAKEAERSDLGKELHDNVNQLLGASRLYLEMAKQGGTNSEMHLSRSSEYTMNAIEEIRKLTKGLATESIQNLGLGHAIEKLTIDTMQVNPVKIIWSFDPLIESRVDDKFKLNIFRIVQEQLNNILKHAHAANVTINLSQTKETVILIIADNGVGFDVNVKRKGIGVDNIRSRAAALNGKADFDSQPGKGCILTVIFTVADKPLMQA